MTPIIPKFATSAREGYVNIIPSNWYQHITTKSSRPDYSAINLLSEIYYWTRPSSNGRNKFHGDCLQLKYSDLQQKLNLKHEAIRCAFVRLEERGLVKREFKSIKTYRGTLNNVMYVHLDLEKLYIITPKMDNQLIKRMRKLQDKSHEVNDNISNISELDSISQSDALSASNKVSTPITIGDKYKDYNFNKDKSLKASSDNKLLEKKKDLDVPLEKKWDKEEFKQKPILSFLPLETEFVIRMNKLMARELPASYLEDAIIAFYQADKAKSQGSLQDITCSERQLIARLKGWVRGEKRSDDDILVAYGLREKTIVKTSYKDENILAKYESSLDTTPIGILKRKIAGGLPKEVALLLLLGTYLNICLSSKRLKITVLANDKTIETSKVLELESQLLPILEDIIGEGATIEFKQLEKKILPEDIEVKLPEDDTYRQVGEEFIKQYGKGIYKSWFEKLRFTKVPIDSGDKTLIITDSEFKLDYIKNNYLHSLSNMIKHYDHDVAICEIILESEIETLVMRQQYWAI